MKIKYPPQRLYTFNHLWVLPQRDHLIIGASPALINPAHFIAGIHTAEPGVMMDEGDEAGHFTLATGRQVPFRMPFSGLLLNTNPLLQTQPGTWRRDPYGLGWLFSMEAVEPGHIKLLLNAAQYTEIAALLSVR